MRVSNSVFGVHGSEFSVRMSSRALRKGSKRGPQLGENTCGLSVSGL